MIKIRKIGIITITDNEYNFGNRLQNYAVITVLKGYCKDVTTINVQEQNKIFTIALKSCINALFGYRLSKSQAYYDRHINFHIFIKKYLHTTNDYLNGKIKPNKYDFFVLGSDQVWNPLFYTPLKKEAFLLTFARPEQKVCFSPSFGVEKLPDEWKEWFMTHLNDFPSLSVREQSGAKIIKELIGKESEVLIDPTLMLNKEDWLRIAKKPKRIDFSKKYILTYFLGKKTERIKNDINIYSSCYGMDVYNLLDIAQPNLYGVGPSEFIYLVSNAALIITDSFHACVFSFIFSKPFLVYSREGPLNNMMSRMDTFLSKFDLKRKYVDSELPNDIFECDYSVGHKQLKTERDKVIIFLNKSLKAAQ